MTTVRTLRLSEAILGGGVLALGLFVAIETARLEVAPSNAAIGPTMFPFIVGGGLIVIGALLLREALFGHVAHERKGVELDWIPVVLVSAGLLLQMFLVETLGWILSTTLLFLAVARAFGSRRILLDLAIGLGLAVLTYGVFNYGLDLSLPQGSLFEDLFSPDDADE